MMKIIILGLVIFTLSSCGVKIQSIVQSGLTKTYENPLIVIPYEKNKTFKFSNNLKRNIEETFSLNNQKVEVLLVETTKNELTFNSNDDIEIKINNAIERDGTDLIIVFMPVRFEYFNDGLTTASYQLIGTDVETKREVWKANFSSSGSYGPSTFAKASAQKIFQKLKEDKILN